MAFGQDETYSGWANSVSHENKDRRQKYDKKSRKFYTEEEAMGKREETSEEAGEQTANEDIIEEVKKMEKKLKEDGLKAAGSANYKSQNKKNKEEADVTDTDSEEDLLKKNADNVRSEV